VLRNGSIACEHCTDTMQCMYTNNPKMPKIRRDAVLFAEKHGVRCAARHFGFSPGAIVLWRKRAQVVGLHPIPTRSSRPHHHPHELAADLVRCIVRKRLAVNRSAEVVQRSLAEDGVSVSLMSVKRTLDRYNLTRKRSPWKRYHAPSPRPVADAPGSLIQADTVHLAVHGKTVLYVFTCIDVYSRWAYARAYQRANCRTALSFVKQAQVAAPFLFRCVQTDNGSEFSTHFTECVNPMTTHTLNDSTGRSEKSALMHFQCISPRSTATCRHTSHTTWRHGITSVSTCKNQPNY
jgi:transposase